MIYAPSPEIHRLKATLNALRELQKNIRRRYDFENFNADLSNRWIATLEGFDASVIRSLTIKAGQYRRDDFLTELAAVIAFLETYEKTGPRQKSATEAQTTLNQEPIDADFSEVTPKPRRWLPRLISRD